MARRFQQHADAEALRRREQAARELVERQRRERQKRAADERRRRRQGERPPVLRFADLGSLIGADSDQQKKQRGDDTVPQPKDKVLPVEPFRTDRWNAMDADVAFRGERIERSAQLPITKLDTHIYLEDGRLRLEPTGDGTPAPTP